MSEPDRGKEDHRNPEYEHELVVLQAMVRQEDRQGDIGWGGTWTKERYQRLKEKHPRAYQAFLARLRVEKARKQHREEILERYSYSPYIEQKSRELPEPGESDRYLHKLERLKYLMILYKLGYGDRMIALAFTNLRNAYPEAYEAFKKELEEQ